MCVEMTHMTRKILVVDDEPDVVRYFKTLLEDSGFDVVTTVDGAQAMEKIRAERPDLVTLDITMPNRSGVRVCRAIKENDRLRSIPVVVVTAFSTSSRSSSRRGVRCRCRTRTWRSPSTSPFFFPRYDGCFPDPSRTPGSKRTGPDVPSATART